MPPLNDVPRPAWLAGLAVIAGHLVVTLGDALGAYGPWFQLGSVPLRALSGAIWAAVAIVAVANPRTRRFGWLVVLSAVTPIWMIAAIPGDVPWSIGWAIGSIGAGLLIHLQVAFPSGRLQGRFDRAVVLAGYVLTTALPLARMPFWDSAAEFVCDPADGSYCPRNVFLAARDDQLVTLIDGAAIALTVLVSVGIVAAVWTHAQAVSAAARRAYWPVLIAAALNGSLLLVDRIANEYRLSDLIEVMSSLALDLVWNALAIGFLAGLLSARLARQRVAALAMELATGVPTGGLRALLARTLQDPSLELAFPDPTGVGYVDVDGRAVAVPDPTDDRRAVTRLEREGRVLALLIHDPSIDEDDPDLVHAVGSVAQMAVDNERLAAQVRAQLAEVRASRERIALAADAERARIERALHGGAQRRLEDLTLRLEAAHATSAGAAELIEWTTHELRVAMAEVRALAHGLQPALLTEAGLAAAVRALAAGAPVPVDVVIPDRRYAAGIESTAYFVIAEALTNVARYAGATGVLVEVREVDGVLEVRIADDGRGGADPDRGTGLRGLLDRVATAGGALVVDSPAGAGTSLTATLPVS